MDLKINFSIFCLIPLLHNAMIKRKKANAQEEKEIFDKLFEPIQIRGMELKNRVMMSAIGTHESAEKVLQISLLLIMQHVLRVAMV